MEMQMYRKWPHNAQVFCIDTKRTIQPIWNKNETFHFDLYVARNVNYLHCRMKGKLLRQQNFADDKSTWMVAHIPHVRGQPMFLFRAMPYNSSECYVYWYLRCFMLAASTYDLPQPTHKRTPFVQLCVNKQIERLMNATRQRYTHSFSVPMMRNAVSTSQLYISWN